MSFKTFIHIRSTPPPPSHTHTKNKKRLLFYFQICIINLLTYTDFFFFFFLTNWQRIQIYFFLFVGCGEFLEGGGGEEVVSDFSF